MHTVNVNTATRESDEHFETNKYLRYAVTDGDECLGVIPAIFFTPSADNMAASWLRQHSGYDGAIWSYWVIPRGVGGNIAPNRIRFITAQTGYIAPEGEWRYKMSIPGNYFESEVSADAAGIIATLMVMNRLSCQVAEIGGEYISVCKHLVSRRDALNNYLSIIQHLEKHLILRAID